jgi:hypothetical protein
MSRYVALLSIPNLRARDLAHMPNFSRLFAGGGHAILVPSFPAVTCPVQANMTTGLPPREHGVVANGFYWRDQRRVEMWTAWNDCIQRPQIWDMLHERDRAITSAKLECDEAFGAQIVRRAIEHPIRMLCANAGVDSGVVVKEVLAGKANFGYNVATGEYEDLVKAGVVDPTKVTRTALQNAASIAGETRSTVVTLALLVFFVFGVGLFVRGVFA